MKKSKGIPQDNFEVPASNTLHRFTICCCNINNDSCCCCK
jgi:hypothetical protein